MVPFSHRHRRLFALAVAAVLTTLGTGDKGWASAPFQVKEALLLAPLAREYRVNLAAYNTFMRPAIVDSVKGFQDRAACRGTLIGQELRRSRYDIVALSETHHNGGVENLRRALGGRFGVRIFGKPSSYEGLGFRPVHGGLSLLSRYAIESTHVEGYDACAGVDCLARKGFVHVVLRIADELRLNLVFTHANAGSSTEQQDARLRQLAQLSSYLRTRAIFRRWPTVLMGDLNVDGRLIEGAVSAEYQRAFETLTIPFVGEPTDPFLHAARTSKGPVAGTENCMGSRMRPCELPEAREAVARNDYIFYWPAADVEVATESVAVARYEDPARRCGTPFLSDHGAPALTLVMRPRVQELRPRHPIRHARR